ncbi:MAG TPA: transporter substrate-binding domain-containing protein [Actinomycetota bacterium]|nr:transporter substrate-binding domain-containing protein [Actinomycetota bacterium]
MIRRLSPILVLVAAFTLLAAACAEEEGGGGGQATGGQAAQGVCASVDTSTDNVLARICSQGSIRVATDQKYKPQSWYDAKEGEWKGFDVEVAQEIAKRLGITADINHQDWEVITAGSWNDRWDMSVGSMTDTIPREKLFHFTPAYYFTPASFAVHESNTSIQNVDTDLDGKKVCVGVSTTYQDYLKGSLVLGAGAPDFEFVVDNPHILTFNTDTDALDQLSLGDGVRCDAAMSAQPTIQAYIDDGGPIKLVGDPLYYEPLSIAFDKKDPVDNTSLVDAVSKIVEDMHADGTLTDLSMKWYGADLTTSIT